MARVQIEVRGDEMGDFTISVDERGTLSSTTRQDIEEALEEALKRVRTAYGIDH